jgi:hypothetical protein
VIFKLCNNHIKYPYIISLMVTGCLGGITLVNMNANMSSSVPLEVGIGYMVFSFFTIISSIVVGVLIGRCVKHFDQ